MFPWERQYLDHLAERKELAFKAWQESGYRSTEAHEQFVRLWVECGKIHRQIRDRDARSSR